MGEIKKLLVPGKIPPATSFNVDDIVINPIDAALYFKDSRNNVKQLLFSGSFISGGADPNALTFASANLNDITFTRSNGKQFVITIDTGSNGGGNPFPFTGSAAISGTLSIDGPAGHITASGNISASGDIIGGTFTSNGNSVISQSGAFVNNEFIVAVGTSAVTSSDALAVDSDGNLGIGTPNPEVRLHMLGEAAQTTQILMEQFNNTQDAPDIRTRRYRGTSASRADVQTGDYLFRLNVHGQDGGASELYGSMRFDVDSSDQDALEWGLQTRDTVGNVSDRITIDSAGDVTISGSLSANLIDGGTF